MFESIKHVTTLSTGSILVLVALLDKVFKSPHWKWVMIVAFGCFTLSVMCAVRLMVYVAGHVGKRQQKFSMTPVYVFMMWSFFAAILSFGVFVIRNLWS